jgi:N-acetylmuramoyl-L-alanine amidase
MAVRTKTLYADKNGAYIYGTKMPNSKPAGLLWHSTGSDNPWVRRYAADANTKDEIIGNNPNGNGFQQVTDRNGRNAAGKSVPCPNAVMGLGTDGKMLTVKILPDNFCPWCSGAGNLATAQKNGFTTNNANFISFYQLEICEDIKCTGVSYGKTNPYNSAQYAKLCYDEMVAFSAEFFRTYFSGNPNSVTPKTLTTHVEGHKMGIASNHADPWHWFGKYGHSGDTLRADVKKALQTPPPPPEEKVTYKVQVGAYSKLAYAEAAVEKAKACGFPDAYIKTE